MSERIERFKLLYDHLDQLFSAYIVEYLANRWMKEERETGETGGLANVTVLELLEWAHQQMKDKSQ